MALDPWGIVTSPTNLLNREGEQRRGRDKSENKELFQKEPEK